MWELPPGFFCLGGGHLEKVPHQAAMCQNVVRWCPPQGAYAGATSLLSMHECLAMPILFSLFLESGLSLFIVQTPESSDLPTRLDVCLPLLLFYSRIQKLRRH